MPSQFETILATITSSQQGDQLVLQQGDFSEEYVAMFFNVIDQSQLVFQQQQNQELIVADEEAQTITIQGMSSYLGYSDIFSTMIWVVGEDYVDVRLDSDLGNTSISVLMLDPKQAR